MRALALALVAASVLAAQQPRVTNAHIDTRAVPSGLERAFHQLSAAENLPAWIGYAVRAVPGDHQMCCYSSFEDGAGNRCCRGCALETTRAGNAVSTPPQPVALEASGYIFVLIRVEQHALDRIRTFSAECELDGGGLPMHWLTEVSPAESVGLLASFAAQPGLKDRQQEGVLAAIALTADPAADAALERFTEPGQLDSLRERSTFWLGSTRGHRGFEALRRMVTQDPSDRVRDKAVFGLSVSKDPEAVAVMIAVAKNDRSSRVRSQALFWLAHKAGERAAAAITQAVESDPDTDVKKRAVFALQQLPPDQGIPLLIQVARTNRNPVVRKQAMFWLGQSNDPRAVQFFEEVLLK